ncbi:GMC oxidoreductase-domain-containing protein [Thermothelomyces heterothallicus CBS 202.75]|uniref:GMC oxidoreductase-domain-containing protein n=1 Tax=Thermothelomyces heterothallicus CBS 202.75 TaxID=1149848 RepID=UPI0037437721
MSELGFMNDLVGDRAYTYENLRKYYEHSFNFGGEISSARPSNTAPSFDRADTGTGRQVPGGDFYAGEKLPASAGTDAMTPGANYVTLLALLQAPQSRVDKPIINPKWLTSRADQEALVAGLRRGRQVFEAIKNITVGPEFWPAPSVVTDQQILEAIRSDLFDMSHATSTCRMGTSRDKTAVADSHGKVFGVRNRPSVQPTVYVLAEKIADDTKNGD